MTAAIQQIDCETEAPLEMERTLRRFTPEFTDLAPFIARGDLPGLFADVESTGLDPAKDQIIQLSLAPFSFRADGEVTAVGQALTYLEDPGVPIPVEITKLTGITDAMVRRKRIDEGAVTELAANAAIVIAHNADFDRKFVEKRISLFKHLRWGCSQKDVAWRDEGFETEKLKYLLNDHCRLFYEGHRADIDCYAGVRLLSTTLPSGKRALASVLDAARVSHARVYAIGSPFELKDVLKARGYYWSDGKDGQPKAWYRDVIAGDAFVEETNWLASNAMVHSPKSVQFDAKRRFSDRVGKG